MFLSPGTMRNQQWVSDDETQLDIDFFQDIQGFGIHKNIHETNTCSVWVL